MSIFFLLLTSMFCAVGTAIVLVEKRFEWPVRPFSILFRRFLQQNVHRKMHRMPKCAICLAFWAAFLTDVAVCVNSGGIYWLWPLSGFAASGATWIIYTLLNHLVPTTAEITTTPAYDPNSLGQLMKAAHAESDNYTYTVTDWDGEAEQMREGKDAQAQDVVDGAYVRQLPTHGLASSSSED